MRKTKSGFTLVELSIVLVIVGLLIGGILVARSMISATQIQAQIRQFQQFDVAIANFQTKYNQIPGDCAICGHASCNAPSELGDGLLEDCFAPGFIPPNQNIGGEPQHFFPDLSTMGMIKDQYIYGGSANYGTGIGSPYPLLAIAPSRQASLMMTDNGQGNLFYLDMNYYGGTWGSLYAMQYDPNNAAGGYHDNQSGSFTPAESLAIDTKMDDGNPSTGNVAVLAMAWPGQATTYPYPYYLLSNYSTGAGYCDSTASQYNLAVTTPACMLTVRSNWDGTGASSH